MCKLLNKGFHLLHPPEPFTGHVRTPHSFADGLLYRFSIVIHSGKLSPGAAAAKLFLRKNLVEQQVNDHAGHGNIEPQRPRPAGELFVPRKILFHCERHGQGNQR